jgi:hypothetical protein
MHALDVCDEHGADGGHGGDEEHAEHHVHVPQKRPRWVKQVQVLKSRRAVIMSSVRLIIKHAAGAGATVALVVIFPLPLLSSSSSAAVAATMQED